MHADLTRWTFDPGLGYRSVLMQQGRVLLDSDWNEQVTIAAHHDEARANDIVGSAGGPAPTDGGPGPFAIVNLADGTTPSAVTWADLGVTPGHYYADGVLAESAPNPAAASPAHGAWPLVDQPHLAAIGGPATDPGLPEPPVSDGDGRWAVYLDVFDRLVTADERPELLESALGGPDTAARAQTAWQVLVAAISTQTCAELADVGTRTPPQLVAALEPAPASADPCSITAGGGYTRLENQLYRVEIFDVDPQPRFVWSRENGSVVAGLVSMGSSTVAGMNAALTLDRTGRDDELSIGQDDLVEITSTDRQLRRQPGFLAQVGAQVDLVIQVAWLDAAPLSIASLGEAPIVRRWEGGPTTLSATALPLEDGITVGFPAGGAPAAGDYWLIPARTARLAYGTPSRQGTLEWPWDATTATPQPPNGPVHHTALLGILARAGGAWTLESDCRSLFLPLTGLSAARSLRLLGGDGQDVSSADATVPQLVRVAVDTPSGPTSGAQVTATASSGALVAAAPDGSAVPGTLTSGGATAVAQAPTDTAGVAAFVWQPAFGLAPNGAPASDLLTIDLDGDDRAPVTATAQLVTPGAGAQTPGVHVVGVTFADGKPLENDTTVPVGELAGGIIVTVDRPIQHLSVLRKPVGRLQIDLPWPVPPELSTWALSQAFGVHTVELRGILDGEGTTIAWRPAEDLATVLNVILKQLQILEGQSVVAKPVFPLLLRFQLDGWAIIDEKDPGLHLNGHTTTVLDGNRTALKLPSTDDVTGGRFETWFWIGSE